MTVALVVIIGVMCYLQPDAFASRANFYNITRNFAFIGIMAIGMVAVIITGGIDLSVGSIMGLVGVVCGVLLRGGARMVRGARRRPPDRHGRRRGQRRC